MPYVTVANEPVYIICERAEVCNCGTCPYLRSFRTFDRKELRDVMCGHVHERVNILKVNQLKETNPNSLFKRKKHGF